MSLAVVAWHIHLFGISTLFDKRLFSHHAITFSDIMNFQFLLLAVPVFFLISLFLFFDHYKTHDGYFKNRIKRIACLYGFWLGLFFLFYVWRYGFSPLLPTDGKNLLMKITSGWSTLYYFFFSLLIVTCLARMVVLVPRYVVWLLFILSLLSLWGVAFLVKIGVAPNYLVAYWNPLNFVPYVFIARLFSGIADQDLFNFSFLSFSLLLLGFVFAACFEWQWMICGQHFQYNDCALPAYTRVSLVLGAILVFRLSWFIHRRPNRLIRFLSDYSLGIYCLHGYASLLVYKRIVSTLGSHGAPLIAFLLIVSLSLAAAVFLRRLLGRRLI
jgi:peptidoglycan/LPS O-acetylase OafA/YrhL